VIAANQAAASPLNCNLSAYKASSGLTSAVDGNVGDAVLLGPPLSVTEDDLDEMVDRLAASVRTTLPC